MESITEILFRLRLKGTRIWVEEGELRHEALIGELSPEVEALIRERSTELLTFMESQRESVRDHTPLVVRPTPGPVPLTVAQKLVWNGLGARLRGLPFFHKETLIRGKVDLKLLADSISELKRRHTSLRTRVYEANGVPMQKVDPFEPVHVALTDLSDIPSKQRRSFAKSVINQSLWKPVDPAAGPLFSVKLIRLGSDEHVLVTGINPIITDAISERKLAIDLWTSYARARQGWSATLPPTAAQYSDFVMWQQSVRPLWESDHCAYWDERLSDAAGMQLVSDGEETETAEDGRLKSLGFHCGRAVTSRLKELSRKEGTSLGMLVLTIYVIVLLRWSQRHDLVIPCMAAGRPQVLEFQDMVGRFACPTYLRVTAPQNEGLLGLLRGVTREYDRSTAHDDFGAATERMQARPFVANPGLNWVPREMAPTDYMGASQVDGLNGIDVGPFLLDPIPNDLKVPEALGIEIDFNVRTGGGAGLIMVEQESDIVGSAWYCGNVKTTCADRLIRNLLHFAEKLLEQPERPMCELDCIP